MRVDFSLEQIFGRNPREVDKLFRSRGLDPTLPYRAKVTFSGVSIEQEIPQEPPSPCFFLPIPAGT